MELVEEKELEQEAERYMQIANIVVGLSLVAICLGAISTNNPRATAWFFSPIVFGLYYHMMKSFPPSIKILKNMLKNGKYSKDEKIQIENIIKKFENKNLNFKKLFSKNIIYFYSSFIFFLILILPTVGESIRCGTWFLDLLNYISNNKNYFLIIILLIVFLISIYFIYKIYNILKSFLNKRKKS